MRWIDPSYHRIMCKYSRTGVKATGRPSSRYIKAQVAKRRKGKVTAHGR